MKGRLTNKVRNEISLRTYYWILVWVLAAAPLAAQSLIDPVSGSLTSFTPINSDYGPRNVTSGTNPHIGIDYHLPQGGKAYAVSSGSIQVISISGSNPFIQVGNWRYFHMYSGQTPDMLWHSVMAEVNVTPKVNIPVIFTRKIINGNLTSTKALAASHEGCSVKDPTTNDMLIITKQVNAGDWIFVSDSKNHLHIDFSPGSLDGWENPLLYIQHQDQYAPTPSVHFQRIYGSQAITFPDSITYGHPMIICPEANIVMDKDLESMSLYTTPEGGTRSLIRSWAYSHHQLSGIPMRVKSSLSAIMNAADSGIYPYPGLVSIDYFKHHFLSRLRSGGQAALCNLEALYPDGYHDVEVVATDITSQSATHTRRMILDNFKPFVRAVNVSTDKLLYGANAYWDAGAEQLGWTIQNIAGQFATGQSDAHISIQTSEPMKLMTVSLTYGYVPVWGQMQAKNSSRTEWEATIPQAALQAAIQAGATGFQALWFGGQDRAGNSLFVPNYPGITPSYLIPKRNNDGSWSGSSYKAPDNNHGFYLKTGPGGSALDAEFIASQTMGTSPLDVLFTDVSSGSPVQFFWNFGNGAVSTAMLPGTVTYTNDGNYPVSYSVSLAVKNTAGQQDIEYKVHYITVYPSGQPVVPEAAFSFTQSGLGVPSTVSFVNQSKGDQLTAHWDFDDGSSSNSWAPVHAFTTPGYFDVVLTVTNQQGNSDVAGMTVFVYPATSGTLSVNFGVNEPSMAGDFCKFTDLSTGVPMLIRRIWDFGDGHIQEYIGNPTHLYYTSGVYQVRLEMRDYLDNVLGACCRMVTVLPNALHNLSLDVNQIKAGDGANGDAFGHALAINGIWMFSGAPYDNDKGSSSGAVYVYRLQQDSTYAFHQKLVPSAGAAYDYFGKSLASDGSWLLAGAPKNANYGSGRVWFFEYDGNLWQERQVMGCPASSKYFFGWAVDLKGDVAIVGAKGSPNKSTGMAVVYRLTQGAWQQEQILVSGLSAIDYFGEDVAIDGDHLILSLRPSSGDKVRFYHYNGQTWSMNVEKNLVDVQSLDLECPLAVIGDTWQNKVLFYKYNGSSWYYDGALTPDDGAQGNDDFGYDVSLAAPYLLVGTPGDVIGGQSSGSAYLFKRNPYGYWFQHRKLLPLSGESGERFGNSVALSHSHGLTGAPGWKSSRGSVYTYPYLTDPCDRVIRLCDHFLSAGASQTWESGSFSMGGPGCQATFSPGSAAHSYTRMGELKDGFLALAGSEFTLTAVQCYSPGTKSGTACPCQSIPSAYNIESQDTKSALQVFPNPARDWVEVRCPESANQAEVRVYNSTGAIVFRRMVQESASMIDVSKWTPGLYIVDWQTETQQYSSHLIIDR